MTRPLEVEIYVDSFAGGGGASKGMELALGRGPDIAINHDAEAIALHAANHPDTEHYQEDVWKVDPVKACAGRPVGLMWLSPDCFPAGTLVLTDKGHRAIETIQVGDRVLTHRARYRAVTEVSRTRRPLLTVRGHGHPGLSVSPEHPFYTRQHSRDAATWTPASLLSRGQYWASPKFFPRVEIPVVPGRGLELDARLMWLAGRYVGDGWTRLTKTRAELVITCGKAEADELRSLLNQWPRASARAGAGELSWHERATTTAYQFTTDNRGLVTWLREHFGHRAESKGLPAWALGMPPALRSALLEGYLSADGHDRKNFRELQTVSKSLACGTKLLAQSLGKTVTMYVRSNSVEIEGRAINARPLYMLRWRHDVDAAHEQTFASGDLRWSPIRETTHTTQEATVYNIGVEEDESYVVEGIVVHNCKHFSKAKGGKPVSKRVRGLAWVAVRWAVAVKPRIIVLENVEEFQGWGPVSRETQRPDPARKGHTFKRFVSRLRALGYVVEWRELRACDYGAPTIRKRLFLIARCDGAAITWPTPTHGKGRALPWRTAAECIDFSIACPSIFTRKKALAENTLRRIAAGLKRFVFEADRPFIVNMAHGGKIESLVKPLSTIATEKGGCRALVAPVLVPRYGERDGQRARAQSVERPLSTIVPTQNGASLVAGFLAKHYGGHETPGAQLGLPISTLTTQDHHHLVATSLVSLRGTQPSHLHGDAIDEPLRTVAAGGLHAAEVRAFLVAFYETQQRTGDLFAPMATVTSKDRFGLVTVEGVDYRLADIGMRMLQPRELYRAQGFPDTYRIDIQFRGKPLSKTAQVRMCGNSVCPDVAAAIIRANVSGAGAEERAA